MDVPTTAAAAAAPGEEICFVCNDASTGYHYGTPSCNGCKTFFRRTVMKNQTFVCQYGGKCIIDKGIRCACRHCRFAKCLAVGMSKDAIQQNRDPIGYTKRTRRYPALRLANGLSSAAAAGPSVHPSGNGPTTSRLSPGVEQTSSKTVTKQIESLAEAEDRLIEELGRTEERVKTVRNSQIFVQKSFLEIMLRPSIFHDRELVERQAQIPYSDVQLRRARHSDHMYWHERDWVNLIEWAKTIPVYETLSFSDKLALLRHSAIAYPSLNQCFYSKVIDMDTIVFPDGVFFDRTPEADRPVSLQRKKTKVFNNLLRPIRKMQLDIREFAAAKTIFFLNPDADELSSEARQRVNEARGATTNALYRYMAGGGRDGESVDRFAKLLLLGTAISTIIVESKEAVVVVNFFEQMQFSQLAKHLLLNAEDEEEVAISASNPDRSGRSAGASIAHTESDQSLSDQSPSWDGASAGCLPSAFSSYQPADSSADDLTPFHQPLITVAPQASSSDPTLPSFTVTNDVCSTVVRSTAGL